jgi:hypothetical protein
MTSIPAPNAVMKPGIAVKGISAIGVQTIPTMTRLRERAMPTAI